MPNAGLWPGQTVIAESRSQDGWTQTPDGEELTFNSDWGFGVTDYGLATYNIVVTADSSGAVTSYGILGQIDNGPGGVNGLLSCTVDQTANTTTCFMDMQIPAAQLVGFAPIPGVGADATISVNITSTTAANGSVSSSYNGGIANPDGSSSVITNGADGSTSVSVTDASGNSSTAGITPNLDGTSTITISTTDKAGNGTYETIDVDAQGNLINDTTTPVGPIASGDGAGDDGTGDGDDEGDDSGGSGSD